MAGRTAQRRADRRSLPRALRATSTAGWLPELGIERCRPQRHVGAIPQGHRHLSGCTLDLDVTEELHAGRWRQVLLVEARRLDELHLGSKGVVEFVRPKSSGVQWPGDEFPERLEVLKLRLVGIVVVRGGVMHIRRQPYRIGDARRLDEAQDLR